jgi:hypothetical protein
MEFIFAEAVTSQTPPKSRARKGAAEMRAEILSRKTNRAGESAEPVKSIDWTQAPGVLGTEWIGGVCGKIRGARDLREAVALAACYLSELIDQEVDFRGHNEAWKQECEAYCWTHYHSMAIETETDMDPIRAMWWMAATIFYTYSHSSELSDWELYEELCDCEPDAAELDKTGAEASFIKFLAAFMKKAHDLLFRSGGQLFPGADYHVEE